MLVKNFGNLQQWLQHSFVFLHLYIKNQTLNSSMNHVEDWLSGKHLSNILTFQSFQLHLTISLNYC